MNLILYNTYLYNFLVFIRQLYNFYLFIGSPYSDVTCILSSIFKMTDNGLPPDNSEVRLQKNIRRMKEDIAVEQKKRQRLRELDCFVLDNSIRESTVGQLRGHTLENKLKIYEEVKKCGFKNIVVASFAHMTRVDDDFVKFLVERGEDPKILFSFSEVTEGVVKGTRTPNTEKLPVGLAKMKKFGLQNPILEIDLADRTVDYKKFTTDNACQLLLKWIEWSLENLSKEAKILVNIRDFPGAMVTAPERVLKVVDFLARLPPEKRLIGIMYEEPTGKYLPEEVGAWTSAVRRTMDQSGWQSGHLLAHVHKRWGLGEMVQLECLVNGANGIWASVCEEGAAMGHSSSTITLMNLVRMGNKKVLQSYNCYYLRTAAINVTNITTGREPHPKQVIYGERALDLSFDFSGIAGGQLGKGDFDMAKFFGEDPPIRISTLASNSMIVKRLIQLFGEDPQFTEETAKKMKEVMIQDLKKNRKEEYMSEIGLAILLDRAGGKLTPKMQKIIEQAEVEGAHEVKLIEEVRKIWDEWDLQDEIQGDDALEFHSFYNGFMAPYFGCFKCDDTRQGLQALDMDADGFVQWGEFLVYLKWALHAYPDIKDADELLSVAFRKGLIPAMRDEILKNVKVHD